MALIACPRKRILYAGIGAGVLAAGWFIAALASPRLSPESFWLILYQTIFSFVSILVFLSALPKANSMVGPGVLVALSLHTLLYYGVANLSPALLYELRPGALAVFERIPPSPIHAYVISTISALLFLLGLTIGCLLANGWFHIKQRDKSKLRSYTWLPDYQLAMVSCLILLVVLGLGTRTYGLQWANTLTDETVASFSLPEQLLFHGLIPFLPIAPVLATTAYIQAANRRQKRLALLLAPVSSLLVLSILMIWRMRSTAIIALLLPLALLAYTGKVAWQRIVLPSVVVMVVAYALVTYVRISNFPALASAIRDGSVSLSDISSILNNSSQNEDVLGTALSDLSYRTAGLEGVAAIANAQMQGQVEPQWGNTIMSGFMQALPASLRPSFEIPERIKTAPSYFGIFKEGDWVTTVLAEFVLDFGPVILFFPALLTGFLLACLDRALLWLGSRPALSGLLVIRLSWLLSVVLFEMSLAERTLLFFKGTIGYTVLLLAVGFIIHFRFRIVRGVTQVGSIRL